MENLTLNKVQTSNTMREIALSRSEAEQDKQNKPVVNANATNTIEQPTPTKGEVNEALNIVNKAAMIEQRSLSFSLDELSGRSIITVKEKTTDQVIRQIPSEELIKVAQDIRRLQDEMGSSLGLLINKQV